MSRNDRFRMVGDELIIGENHIPLPRHLRRATTERARLEADCRRAEEACQFVRYTRGAKCLVCGGTVDIE